MEKPITAILVDDEFYARKTLRLLLEKDPEIDLLAECPNGEVAIEKISELRPQLVFLDIQMPEIDGFEVIRSLEQEVLPHFIFTTAFDQYALKAFEVHALDYLLKPFDDKRFHEALERAKQRIRETDLQLVGQQFAHLMDRVQRFGRQEMESAPTTYSERILVKTGQKSVIVPVEEIEWIEAADQYVKLHVEGKSYLHRESLTRLEKRLDPKHFFRTHRSFLVRISQIRELETHFKGDLLVALKNGGKVKLARNRKEALEEILGLS